MSMMMELTPDDVHDLLTKGGIDPFPETDEHGGDAQGDGKTGAECCMAWSRPLRRTASIYNL